MISQGTIAARGTATGTFASKTTVVIYTSGPASFQLEVNESAAPGVDVPVVADGRGLKHEVVCCAGDWTLTNDSDAQISYSIDS